MSTAIKSQVDDHQAMVHDCELREPQLNDWEAGFIDSISRQLSQNSWLSPKQVERLDEIWERVTA